MDEVPLEREVRGQGHAGAPELIESPKEREQQPILRVVEGFHSMSFVPPPSGFDTTVAVPSRTIRCDPKTGEGALLERSFHRSRSLSFSGYGTSTATKHVGFPIRVNGSIGNCGAHWTRMPLASASAGTNTSLSNGRITPAGV